MARESTTAETTAGRAVRLRGLVRWETALVVLLVLILVVGDQASARFLTSSNLFYVGLDVGEIALMALPMTLLMIVGEIDLSVASVLGLSSSLMGALWNDGWPIQLILPVVIVVGAVAGAVNGVLVTRLGLPSLAVTIGTMTLYRGLALVVLGDQSVADFPSQYTQIGTTPIGGTQIPWSMGIFAVLAVVFGVVLHMTRFGRSVFAAGANQEAAFFAGVRVKRLKLVLFVVSGAIAAAAGIIWTFRFSSARADNGTGLELSVVATVLLGGVSIFGGRGTVFGTVVAVFVLGGIRDALILNNVSNETLNIVTGSLLILSVLAPNTAAIARRLRRLSPSRGGGPPRPGVRTAPPAPAPAGPGAGGAGGPT